MRVRVNRIRQNAKLALQKSLYYVNCLFDPGRKEVGKVGHVVVSYVSVGDGAHFSVAEMIADKEILFVEIVLSPICQLAP